VCPCDRQVSLVCHSESATCQVNHDRRQRCLTKLATGLHVVSTNTHIHTAGWDSWEQARLLHETETVVVVVLVDTMRHCRLGFSFECSLKSSVAIILNRAVFHTTRRVHFQSPRTVRTPTYSLSTLSHKSETVSQKWDCRRKVRLSPNFAVFCDSLTKKWDSLTFVRQSHFCASLTFLRQCGHGFRGNQPPPACKDCEQLQHVLTMFYCIQ